MGQNSFGLDPTVIGQYAQEVKSIIQSGVEVAIVIGGGHIYRGMNESETGIERAHGDYMGMLATVINGMAMQAMLEAGVVVWVCGLTPQFWPRSQWVSRHGIAAGTRKTASDFLDCRPRPFDAEHPHGHGFAH